MVYLIPGNKKSTFDRASFLPAELINITPFSGLFFMDFFLWTFLGTFKKN
nr:MAG TPA: hypothetical protein [Caudoviricetes sp.]